MSKAQFLKEILKPNETYAGLALGVDGKPDEHVILLHGYADGLTWSDAVKWAAGAGGRLPTRQEQALLYANCKQYMKPVWHWSGETHKADASYAWDCYFYHGDQGTNHKSNRGTAVAVRTIQLPA
jgi:hypothetical protein